MFSRVTIHDHITKRDHVSVWNVTEREGFIGAAFAAFVSVFGSSPGPLDLRYDVDEGAEMFLRGMHVECVRLTFAEPAVPCKTRREERKAVAA